jgi:hypothetical protein
MAYDRSGVGTRSVTIVAGCMLAILSFAVAVAATKEEVAHCRAIDQRAERLDCFKFLKTGQKAKTEDAAPARTEDAASAKSQDAAPADTQDSEPLRTIQASPAKTQDVGPAVTKRVEPAKVEDAASAKTGDAVLPNTEEPASAKTRVLVKTKRAARIKMEDAISAKSGNAVPAKAEDAAREPVKTENGANSKTGDMPSSATSDDLATTGSIDRFSSVPGQPLCVDRTAVAAMLVAELLTSNSKEAATAGCQTLPEDATLKILERYPSVFSSLRIVRVNVTSPTHPELAFGFTVEMGRQKN